MGLWDAWIGREERRIDRVDPGMTARWLATLDRHAPAEDLVPLGLHWCLCLPDAPTAALGNDGHPKRDDSASSFLPPVPLPRRMWASSKVDFIAPLHIGEGVTRISRIATITEKSGGSGALVFVDVVHEMLGDAGLAVRETQSIVYRDAAAADAPLSPTAPRAGCFDPAGWEAHRVVTPDAPLLFRYSALTFNSHRIHYDRPYARDVERYRSLVVHGPLTATLLLDLARRTYGDNGLSHFAFRGLSPAMCGEGLHLVMRGQADTIELEAFSSDGRAVMSATATKKD